MIGCIVVGIDGLLFVGPALGYVLVCFSMGIAIDSWTLCGGAWLWPLLLGQWWRGLKEATAHRTVELGSANANLGEEAPGLH